MIEIAPISQRIWDIKYRLKDATGTPVDKTPTDSWRRIARALASVESEPDLWEGRFFEALEDFKILPAGRIVAGAGAERKVTLFNCFVMGEIPDDMGGIFDALKEAALTLQQGGGIGYDFSTLRPKGAPVHGVGADASGPITFMDVWDAMCRTILSAGSRRGAMMAVMDCAHPDIEAFVEAKREPGRLRMFNLSVLISDAFMDALRADGSWDLAFDGAIYKTVRARDLWDKIMHATYDYAEPGVIFIDRINRLNNLAYCETIRATNPCGEQPLPPYGACLLGSINLTRLIETPFEEAAHLDLEVLADLTRLAVRMLDNVIDLSGFPLDEQRHEAHNKRRIGLGVTGLADALIMCRARYGEKRAVALTKTWMETISQAAYEASVDLAEEKGAFALFDAKAYLQGEMIRRLDPQLRDRIADHGIRNALLTSIAPTGTISLFADNVSSGIEPVFSFRHTRSIRMPDGSQREEEVSDHAYRLWRRMYGDAPLPDYFVDAQSLTPMDHVVMQAAAQEYVDSSISKTINCPEDISFETFSRVYQEAYDRGCKGCTTYRPNDVTGAVLSATTKAGGEMDSAQQELPLEFPSSQPRAAPDAQIGATVHQMFRPLDRPEQLPGATYKVRWPESDHAIYITLNDLVDDSGRVRPFEVFINSKNTEHYAWTVALTRMISAVFRRGGDVTFVVEELKAVFDPRGGYWVEGRYVPSLLAAIGEVIERHMINIGFVDASKGAQTESNDMIVGMSASGSAQPVATAEPHLPRCAQCSHPSVVHRDGCKTCLNCGYSECN